MRRRGSGPADPGAAGAGRGDPGPDTGAVDPVVLDAAGDGSRRGGPGRRPRVVVVGTGFAGYHCLRELERLLPVGAADVVAVNPTDYMLYVPLLPEVAAGVLDPRRVAVPVRAHAPRARLVLGTATALDLPGRAVTVVDVEGREHVLGWDRLVLACGSVTRLLSIPGVAEHALGFKSVGEALYLRDHILGQLDLAAQSEDPAEREQRSTFVVVGAGYTGAEVAAQGAELTREAMEQYPTLRRDGVRWVLVDAADRVLPGLDPKLSAPAERVLRRRGIDVRLGTTVTAVSGENVWLSDGSVIASRTVVWCVGVRPDPLVASLGLATDRGRVSVGTDLSVPGCPGLYAAGDAAGVPDVTHPGRCTPMTAQHAQRQGRLVAVNVAASLGYGRARRYRHRDLGFLVDLGGGEAVANPLGVPLSGRLARLLTRGYHLRALPAWRLRVVTDWFNEAVGRRQVVQFGLVPVSRARLAETDGTAAGGATPGPGPGSRPGPAPVPAPERPATPP